jgi:hypothetical protein
MLTGKDVNEILSVAFITEPVAKKTRMGISPRKVLNPQPISSTVPRTRSVVRATPIIHIQDDPEPDTHPSTIITEHPPSPPQPQSPPPETNSPPQTTDPEPMQLDPPELPEQRPELPETSPELPEQRPELPGPNPEVPEQRLQLTGLNPEAQDQQIVPFVQHKDTQMQMVEKLQVQSPQHTSSMTKVEGAMGSATLEVEAHKEEELPEVQKEPETTSGKSATSTQEQMELVLQNPQQCTELLQLCLARTEVLTLLPSTLRLRLVPGPSTGEEEVETPSEHSMTSGLPLQVRAPRDATPSSADLAQWPTMHLVGMIRASTDQLEQRLQQAERSAEFAREEALLVQACRK